MTTLLDANVLIALAVDDHVHHLRTEAWFSALEDTVATCPVTQGALVRHVVRAGGSATAAIGFVGAFANLARHTFWPDDLNVAELPPSGIIGHRQVTDAYLAQLARRRGARLATLDKGMVAAHGDVAELVGGP